jgi:hypothetical protein|tara:strand:+ start:382 stop:654 length:273 start_codon:yes stop_codon:yes gene_type:complete
MALTENDIRERRELIITEIQNMQNRLAELDREKTNAIANMNALRGAQQQCEFFLETLDSEGDISAAIAPGVPPKEKKVTKTPKEENGKDD